ncbi:MAG: enoyl-CoA hydratase/isomerase family protein [Solirubrobacterales bacterium]|nr:enoyl-CoA hydratase/isomerase family protein [Solirubrobacterales bacterium]
MSTWRLERRGAVAIAAFSAPPRNFMTFAAMTELEAIVREVASDDSLIVLMIASDVPHYFIAHGDLEDLLRLGRGQSFDGDVGSWQRVPGLFASMPQIVVAAIDGQAWGGGCEFAMFCTLRVASPRAHFCLPEVALGMMPGGGGTQRLPRLVGAGRAAEIILSGRVVQADEALRIGLVDAVLTEAAFLEAALAWTQRIARRPIESLRAVKRALVQGAELPLSEGLALEGQLVGPLLATPTTMALEEAAIERYRSTPPDRMVVF